MINDVELKFGNEYKQFIDTDFQESWQNYQQTSQTQPIGEPVQKLPQLQQLQQQQRQVFEQLQQRQQPKSIQITQYTQQPFDNYNRNRCNSHYNDFSSYNSNNSNNSGNWGNNDYTRNFEYNGCRSNVPYNSMDGNVGFLGNRNETGHEGLRMTRLVSPVESMESGNHSNGTVTPSIFATHSIGSSTITNSSHNNSSNNTPASRIDTIDTISPQSGPLQSPRSPYVTATHQSVQMSPVSHGNSSVLTPLDELSIHLFICLFVCFCVRLRSCFWFGIFLHFFSTYFLVMLLV